MLNLDTHILIFALTGELRPSEHDLLSKNNWSISAIVYWEIAKLAELGRIDLDLEDAEVVRALCQIHAWPLDFDVARASTRLDIDGDPADQIIAATSVVHRLPLVTRDRRLLASEIVPLAGG